MTGPFWITATPPTPDSELHIGHLAGPYVAADMLSRFLRADGTEVRFTTGTADHDSSVEARALLSGRKPTEVAAGYREAITADWLRSKIAFDQVVHSGEARTFVRWVQDLYAELAADGIIVPRTRVLPHCGQCDRWLHGARAAGVCPHCGASADGGMCRECARPHDGAELLDARCTLCGSAARPRRCRRPYLPLEPFREQLSEYWSSATLPPRLTALCEQLLEDGLPDVAVGHPGEWGVPAPLGDFPECRIDPCFEAAAIHLYGYDFDSRPEPVRTTHFCGFGHSFCQVVLLPVLQFTQGLKLPQDFFVNEPFLLTEAPSGDGPDHPWALDLLTEYGSDTLRRHVLQERPSGRRITYRDENLRRTRELLDGAWNDWLGRLFTAVREECGGTVPDAEPGGIGWPTLRSRLERAVADLREAYGPTALDPRRSVATLDEVVRCANDFGHLNEPERHRPAGHGGQAPALVAQLAAASALSSWAHPVMPEGADRLAGALGVAPRRAVTAAALAAPPPGVRLAPPSGPVFGF